MSNVLYDDSTSSTSLQKPKPSETLDSEDTNNSSDNQRAEEASEQITLLMDDPSAKGPSQNSEEHWNRLFAPLDEMFGKNFSSDPRFLDELQRAEEYRLFKTWSQKVEGSLLN